MYSSFDTLETELHNSYKRCINIDHLHEEILGRKNEDFYFPAFIGFNFQYRFPKDFRGLKVHRKTCIR